MSIRFINMCRLHPVFTAAVLYGLGSLAILAMRLPIPQALTSCAVAGIISAAVAAFGLLDSSRRS